FFFFQAEDGIRDGHVTGVQTCALPIFTSAGGSDGPPGTHAAARFAPRRTARRSGRSRAPRGPGSPPLEPSADRRGTAARVRGAPRRCEPARAAGRDRGRALSGGADRGHGLARDRSPLRSPGARAALACRVPEPRGRGRDGRRPAAGARPHRRSRRRGRARSLSSLACRARRSVAAPRRRRGSGEELRAGALAGDERRRASVSRTAPARGPAGSRPHTPLVLVVSDPIPILTADLPRVVRWAGALA